MSYHARGAGIRALEAEIAKARAHLRTLDRTERLTSEIDQEVIQAWAAVEYAVRTAHQMLADANSRLTAVLEPVDYHEADDA